MILHITTPAQWARLPQQPYFPPEFAADGFVHCSTAEQVLTPANALFVGRGDLVLLCIDESKLTSPMRYEDCYDAGESFPHVYGGIDRASVVSVIAFPPTEDGTFELPDEVRQLSR